MQTSEQTVVENLPEVPERAVLIGLHFGWIEQGEIDSEVLLCLDRRQCSEKICQIGFAGLVEDMHSGSVDDGQGGLRGVETEH